MALRASLEAEIVDDCVLVVDDERPVRELVAGILARAGHRVMTASSAAAVTPANSTAA